MMYIYRKQCEIKQKNHWNSSNGQIHWFPIDFLWKWSKMDQNYDNTNAFFLYWKRILGIHDIPCESWYMVYGNITGEFPRIRYRYQRIGGKFSFFGWCCYPYRENLVTLLENSREFGTSTRELTGNFHFLVGTTGKILYWKKYQNRYGENLVPKIGIYTYKYNIGGRPSDNFEATRRAHSSFLSCCLILSFRPNFWTKILIWPISTKSNPPCHG